MIGPLGKILFVATVLLFNHCNGDMLTEIEKRLTCAIPRDLDSITRAALLQQCMSKSKGWGNETQCFPELGCFEMTSPWVSMLRPLPQPMEPELIGTKIYLVTRKDVNSRFTIPLWPKISMENSDFDANRPYNVFITHGFQCDANFTWQRDLSKAYLKKRDANVFIVDWGDGSKILNYGMAASNTRIVAAEMARLGNYLISTYNVNSTATFHLIGHSLGAQISGYMGKTLEGKVGRITALDAAQPGFEGCDDKVHLTKNDAVYVEAIHTNARPFLTAGCGWMFPFAHVDIYVNGGALQPDCPFNWHYENVDMNITSIEDFFKIPVEILGNFIGCSHLRSIDYFLESVENDDCIFWGRHVPTLGTEIYTTKVLAIPAVVSLIMECTIDKCLPLGLETPEWPARGVFALVTNGKSKFCMNDEFTTSRMKQAKLTYVPSTGPSIPLIPSMPTVPSIPSMPTVSSIPSMPNISSIPSLPKFGSYST